jgi:putative DNA-invertase from lambdoid prophage Rac
VRCINGTQGFLNLLNKLGSGDLLVVTKLNRLGRNAMDIRSIVGHLAAIGLKVHCLALGGVDPTSPAGKMTMGVTAAVAEFERDLLIERTQSGLTRAKSEGKTLGRTRGLGAKAAKQLALRPAKGEAVEALAREFGVRRRSNMRIRQASITGLEYHVHRNSFYPHVTRRVSNWITTKNCAAVVIEFTILL